ncbi:hypothetical protein HMPREF0262_03743 [Clostridium sp. ATCC 29733]|nr:hypothetical protein HMPREF0262_03743 [Clostridium sp. ATCC 29733]
MASNKFIGDSPSSGPAIGYQTIAKPKNAEKQRGRRCFSLVLSSIIGWR